PAHPQSKSNACLFTAAASFAPVAMQGFSAARWNRPVPPAGDSWPADSWAEGPMARNYSRCNVDVGLLCSCPSRTRAGSRVLGETAPADSAHVCPFDVRSGLPLPGRSPHGLLDVQSPALRAGDGRARLLLGAR